MIKITRFLLATLATTGSCAVNADALKLGNEPHAFPSISGPQKIETQQGLCRYRFVIGTNTHARYNDPDIIIYQSQTPLKESQIPYLDQAETSSGYDWTFSNPGDRKSRWFGLMCDSTENFPFGYTAGTDVPPELEQVLESNGRKCPAELRDGKFVPKPDFPQSKGYIFKSISYNNWNGFVLTHTSAQSNNHDFIRFCLVHNGSVIVGTTEAQSPNPKLDERLPDEVELFLKKLYFSEAN